MALKVNKLTGPPGPQGPTGPQGPAGAGTDSQTIDITLEMLQIPENTTVTRQLTFPHLQGLRHRQSNN